MHTQTTFQDDKAVLYLVSTPIGNLKDFSLRAIETLNAVDVIYAEDTRTSGVLLKHHNITTKLRSYHEHNEQERQEEIVRLLGEGDNIALISDAGTPLISDPGETLIKKVRDAGFGVSNIPGPTAIISALVASNLQTSPFTFIGFLPSKKNLKEKLLKDLSALPHTLIFFESPHRIHKTLATLYDVLGNRQTCLARELTKRYESFIHFTLSEHEKIPDLKGEIVLVIDGAKQQELSSHDMIEHVQLLIADGKSEMEAIKMVAKLRNLKKNTVYMPYKTQKKSDEPDNRE